MAGDLALASYHDLKGKMIMQVNMKKGNGKNSITSKQFNRGLIFQLIATGTCNTRIELSRRTGLAKTTVTNIVACLLYTSRAFLIGPICTLVFGL